MSDTGKELPWISTHKENKPTKGARNMILNTSGDNLLCGTSRL